MSIPLSFAKEKPPCSLELEGLATLCLLPRRTARPFPSARRGALPKRDSNGAAEAGPDKKPLPLSKGGDRGEGMSIHLSFAKKKPPRSLGLEGIGHAMLRFRVAPRALSPMGRLQKKRICP